ncbi:hypothetical protein [uncultured Helicobacter sp.]
MRFWHQTIIESRTRFCIWSRSGVSEDLFLASDNKSVALAIKNYE